MGEGGTGRVIVADSMEVDNSSSTNQWVGEIYNQENWGMGGR